MSKKHRGGPGPIPPGNQPHAGPGFGPGADEPTDAEGDREALNAGAAFQDQDPQRRLGGFETAGEHSRQQPGQANDGDRHSK